jgi:serine/threonine protein kinase
VLSFDDGSKHLRNRETIKESSLKDFEVTECVSAGDMVEVLIAIHKKTNTIVALKCFDKSQLAEVSDEAISIVRKQFSLHDSLVHHNLVHVFCTFETEETIYVVMEHVNNGLTLLDVMNELITNN